MTRDLFIQYLDDTDKDFPMPEYQSSGSSGLDIRAYLPISDQSTGTILLPQKRLLISSGFKIEIPNGFEGHLRARSGLALKYGICLANGVGTIDSDYRGDLGVLLINLGSLPYTINHGQRIAQLIIAPYLRVKPRIVTDLSKTDRGNKGYGSTGHF